MKAELTRESMFPGRSALQRGDGNKDDGFRVFGSAGGLQNLTTKNDTPENSLLTIRPF